MSRTLEEVAETVEYFERAYLFRNPAEIRLFDPDLKRHNRYGVQSATAIVRNFRLRDVVLDGTGLILLHDGAQIADTRYLLPHDYQIGAETQPLTNLPNDADYILGFNRGHVGYQHWIMQCLPAIDWGLRHRHTRPVRLVLPELAPWEEDLLTVSGCAHVPRITVEPGKFYAFPQLDYAEYLNGKPAHNICTTVYETAQRILQRLPPPGGNDPVLFVPCSKPYYGKITNEQEVTDLFKRFGAVVVTGDLKAEDRINLFRQAEAVVGPFGQGLADVVFCRPGTLLWEMIPRHHQNVAINRLAQLAQVDYWGDVFERESGSGFPAPWTVDLDRVHRRLAEISERLSRRRTESSRPNRYIPVRRNGKPLDELMLAYESLGQDCAFGLMQRHAGVEPLGLYRFSGTSLGQLLRALDSEFEGVGDPDNFDIVLGGEPPHEYMIADRTIGGYHTFISPETMTPDELRVRQARHLKFLRRKILEDLQAAEKIWVWKETVPSSQDRILELLTMLRRFGPNKLLWATMGDEANPPGKVEQLAPDLIRGYVRPTPEPDSDDIFPAQPWFEVCEDAYRIWHPDAAAPQAAAPQADEPALEAALPLSAMDILRQGSVATTESPRTAARTGFFTRIRSSLLSRR